MNSTPLCDLFYKYLSDKCPRVGHIYSTFYYNTFKNYKNTFKNIIEIGVGTTPLMKPLCGEQYMPGASLRAWRDFFPQATIFGLDIEKEVLFNEDRINCFYTDQSNKNSLTQTIKEIRNYKNNENLFFDLIIDDGSHNPEHIITTFETLKEYVRPNGFYVIEDVQIYFNFFKNYNYKHFKIIEDDNEGMLILQKQNKLFNFPKVNCMSLFESVERRATLTKQFELYGVNDINFSLSKKFENSNVLVTGKHSNTLLNGTKGCCVSHLKNIKQWLENSQETEEYGFFCEDDLSLEPVLFWNKTWREYIKELPEDWECVQLVVINDDINSLNCSKRKWNDWSVTAYILKRNFAKKIINHYCIGDTYKLELPEPNSEIQPLMENLLYTVGQTYTLPLFVENLNFKTTILPDNKDINATSQHKVHHIAAANNVLQLWKNKKTKIVDCFIYFNEKELLELRINLLKDYVDEFLIIEGNYTFSGQQKNYTCKQLIEDLQLPKEKIRIFEIDLNESMCGLPTEYDLFYDNKATIGSRERIQRDYLHTLLHDYTDDTVFIVSDCDEIINPVNINWIANIVRSNISVICKIPLVALEGRADYRLYNQDTLTPYGHDGAMFFATKKQLLTNLPNSIRSNYKINLPITYITQNNKKVEDLGWHFGWMGGVNRVKTKAQSYSHFGAVLDNFIYKECYGSNMLKYFDEHKIIDGGLPVSGLVNAVIKPYPINNLPEIIFTLPRVKNFLLPDVEHTSLESFNWLENFATNTENAESNFHAGLFYFNSGHTAPALSFFLRCAERTNDVLLAYEALIYGYLCYKEQKIRDETAKSLIMHAICLQPERPEARWLLSEFYEQKQLWMYSYYHAILGLKSYKSNLQPLKFYKDFPGKQGLLFQKAISGYWWGKNEECKTVLLDLYNNYQLNESYKQSVKENLKRIGIEIS